MAQASVGELAGRVAWVTGGASGMGLAAAIRLAIEADGLGFAAFNITAADTLCAEPTQALSSMRPRPAEFLARPSTRANATPTRARTRSLSRCAWPPARSVIGA